MALTLKDKDAARKVLVERAMGAFADEDMGFIASNKFNFPTVWNGEEIWVEVTGTIPKENGDEGYLKREEYDGKVAKRAEREKAKAAKVAKKEKGE